MSRQRYEVLPQRDEIIILDSIRNPNYNYNSATPNSVPSSVAPSNVAPSIHSIPNSPPPSFHTHSSPSTPRPTPSTVTNADYAELWGVAASTVGAQTELCTGSEALDEIANLKNRVERLEEAIGRLLLEKENNNSVKLAIPGSNCCVTFRDASPSLEREVSAGSNCCVTFAKSDDGTKRGMDRNGIRPVIALLGVMFLICSMAVGIVAVKQGPRNCRFCEVDTVVGH